MADVRRHGRHDGLAAAHQLAGVHRQAGDPSAARRELEEAYAAGQRRLSDADPLMLAISFDLGVVADELGNRHEARRALTRVATTGPAVLGEDHWAVRQARAYLGEDPPTVRLDGDQLAPEDANFDATYGKHPPSMGPDEVGSHPASRSPFGLDDMAGNAFEWVRAPSRRESVIRGGSYFYAEVTCRSTNRSVVGSGYREPSLGLRVCASAKRR